MFCWNNVTNISCRCSLWTRSDRNCVIDGESITLIQKLTLKLYTYPFKKASVVLDRVFILRFISRLHFWFVYLSEGFVACVRVFVVFLPLESRKYTSICIRREADGISQTAIQLFILWKSYCLRVAATGQCQQSYTDDP